MDVYELQAFITEQKGVSPLKYWIVGRVQAEDGQLNVFSEELKVSPIFFFPCVNNLCQINL